MTSKSWLGIVFSLAERAVLVTGAVPVNLPSKADSLKETTLGELDSALILVTAAATPKLAVGGFTIFRTPTGGRDKKLWWISLVVSGCLVMMQKINNKDKHSWTK
jgi:hypothetical protein